MLNEKVLEAITNLAKSFEAQEKRLEMAISLFAIDFNKCFNALGK